MFERYTEQARRSLFYARYESSLLGSLSIEPEHLLLGILRESAAVADFIPAEAADAIRQELLQKVGTRPAFSTSVEIPFAHVTKSVLQTAEREADAVPDAHIGTEHLLVALATTAPTDAVLTANGFEASRLRGAIRERGGGRPTRPPDSER
jgi:ATP-dependent Clp protease ATP-binding subunit ClpC